MIDLLRKVTLLVIAIALFVAPAASAAKKPPAPSGNAYGLLTGFSDGR